MATASGVPLFEGLPLTNKGGRKPYRCLFLKMEMRPVYHIRKLIQILEICKMPSARIEPGTFPLQA